MIQIVQPLAIGALSVGSCVPLTDLYQWGVCVYVCVFYFLTFWHLLDAPISSCIVLVPVLKSAIVQGSLVPFFRNQLMGTK